MRPCFASLIVVAVSLHASAVPTTNSNGSVMTPNSELTRNQLVATDVSGLLSSESDPNVVFTNGELLVHGERVKIGPDETEVQEIASAVVAPVASSVTNLSSSVSDLQSSKADRSEIPGNYLSVSNKAMTAVQAESDPTVYAWAKQPNPPAEADPTVKPWAKADKPPAETDPTVPAWAKQANPPQTMTTNAVDALANSAVVTNALTVATTNRVAAHVKNTDNPHAVTAAQVGAVPLVKDQHGEKTAVTIGRRHSYSTVGANSLANGRQVTASGDYSHAEGDISTASGVYSHAEGLSTTASGDYSHAEGFNTIASGDYSHAEGLNTIASGDYSHAEGLNTEAYNYYAFVWNGDYTLSNKYHSHGEGTFNINPAGGLDGFYIGEQTLYAILTNKADKADISATDPAFSNAVLAVGLNIDTNSVAVLNEIASTFGGFPLGAGETATTIGGLLAALAAAVAWLKKNKVQTLKLEDESIVKTAENGVAKLDDFFKESNSLLNGRLVYERNATGLKDRAFNALTFDGTEYNLSTALAAVTPTASGQPRDLLIVATATAATTISFTAGTIKGDKPTIDGVGKWLITLTEFESGVWYCRQIKMEDAA